jgi:hypothetical protein
MEFSNINKRSCGNIRDTGYVAIQQPTTLSVLDSSISTSV